MSGGEWTWSLCGLASPPRCFGLSRASDDKMMGAQADAGRLKIIRCPHERRQSFCAYDPYAIAVLGKGRGQARSKVVGRASEAFTVQLIELERQVQSKRALIGRGARSIRLIKSGE
jgi:hypothetical protein